MFTIGYLNAMFHSNMIQVVTIFMYVMYIFYEKKSFFLFELL